MSSDLIREWIPVRVKKTRQNKDPESRSDSIGTERPLVDHQHIEYHDRRQAQDHRPDAERPENVLHTESLFLSEGMVLTVHDAPPRFWLLCGRRYTANFKNLTAVSLAFEHRSYRRLTTIFAPARDPSVRHQHVKGQHWRQPEYRRPQAE
jgi:hypothetical protein